MGLNPKYLIANDLIPEQVHSLSLFAAILRFAAKGKAACAALLLSG